MLEFKKVTPEVQEALLFFFLCFFGLMFFISVFQSNNISNNNINHIAFDEGERIQILPLCAGSTELDAICF